jgi:glyoxylase-like metal-dependent hydrolase (beta-lactamase superfamily II)
VPAIHHFGGIASDSNIYLIDDDTVTLIDAGSGEFFEDVVKEMARQGFSPKDVDLIVNTHCHFDHAGGDLDFVKASKCEVAIHELEADLMRKGDQVVTCARMFGRKLEPLKIQRELKDGDRLELGETLLEVIHTPGHTAGSISLLDPAKKILFTGDTVFCDGVGRTDLPTGDAKALVLSIKRLAKLDVVQMYPGHGSPLKRDISKRISEAIKEIYL